MGNIRKTADAAWMQELLDEIIELLDSGHAAAPERRHGVPCKLAVTKTGHARRKTVKIQEINRILGAESTFEQLLEFSVKNGIFEEERIPGKRIYRRKDELPDPTKPHWAEVNRVSKNRSKTQINLRLDPELLQLVDRAAEESGLNRTVWITSALIEQIKAQGLTVTDDLVSSLDGPS